MFVTKNILFLCTIALLSACSVQEKKETACTTKETCLKNNNCLCWCSQACSFRKKTAEDSPIYVENDVNGKLCYCKQWDLDLYKENCEKGKDIPQPAGAK